MDVKATSIHTMEPNKEQKKMHDFTPNPSRSSTPVEGMRKESGEGGGPVRFTNEYKGSGSGQGQQTQPLIQQLSYASGQSPSPTTGQQVQTKEVAKEQGKEQKAARVIEIAGVKYSVGKRLGDGSFGVVYAGKALESGEEIAIKVESASTDDPQLAREYKIYKTLQGIHGVPQAKGFVTQSGRNIMIMDRLGSSLEDLFEINQQKFGLKTVLHLIDQIMVIMEGVHNGNYIHRDIKPDNFLVGVLANGSENRAFVIDFGLSKRYRDPSTHEHIPFSDKKRLTGTIRYASLNTHNGLEQSRRDDLESIGFMMVFFLNGRLPWQGLVVSEKNLTVEEQNKIKMTRIRNLKDASPQSICAGLPEEFEWYLSYCRSLKFEEQPDYSLIRKKFRELYYKRGFECDVEGNPIVNFEWNSKLYANYVAPTGIVRPAEIAAKIGTQNSSSELLQPVSASESVISVSNIQLRNSAKSQAIETEKVGAAGNVDKKENTSCCACS